VNTLARTSMLASALTLVAGGTACAILLIDAGAAVSALHLAATCLGTFRTASFAQAVLHRWVGHGGLIGSIRRSHIRSHHSIFKGRNFEAERYAEEEKSVSHAFVPIAIAIGLLACWLLPLELAVAALLSLVVTYGAHVYLHEHFHLTGSWLMRFSWFRRLKELHRIHHSNPRRNFGVLDHASDRLFGTFTPAAAAESGNGGHP
jgi:fatty acid hydroxylase family protein